MHPLKHTYYRLILLPLCYAVASSWMVQARAFLTTDPFVQASPLCAAAACADGVVMVAFHTAPCESYEPLLLNPDERLIEEEIGEYRLLNSSIDSRRIVSLADDGVKLITSGWRADGAIFCQKCRSILKSDTAVYGNAVDLTALASEASLWLSRCAYSGDIRSLSCAGLMATVQNDTPLIYLVDSTGYLRVRAFCLGAGSNSVNTNLSKTCFSDLSHSEALEKLIGIIRSSVSGEHLAEDAYVETFTLRANREASSNER